MDFSIARADLAQLLRLLAPNLKPLSKTPHPFQGFISVKATGKRKLTLTTNTYDAAARAAISTAEVRETGQVALVGALLPQIVNVMTGDTITFTLQSKKGDDEGRVKISDGSTNFVLAPLAPAEWQEPKWGSGQSHIEVSSGVLLNAIKCALNAVATDFTRPILSGFLMKPHKDCVDVVATDSYKLVRSQVKDTSDLAECLPPQGVIVSPDTGRLLLTAANQLGTRLETDEEDDSSKNTPAMSPSALVIPLVKLSVGIDLADKKPSKLKGEGEGDSKGGKEVSHLEFSLTEGAVSLDIVARTIEGVYPNYTDLISKAFKPDKDEPTEPTEMRFDRKQLQAAVKQISVLAATRLGNQFGPSRVKLKPTKKGLLCEGGAETVGNASTLISLDTDNDNPPPDDYEVTLDIRHFESSLGHFPNEMLRMTQLKELDPVVLTSEDNDTTALVMPIRAE